MHRFTVSMLALSGAFFLPHGSGHADPRVESGPAHAQSVPAKENDPAPKKAGNTEAPVKKSAPPDPKKSAGAASKGTAGSKSAPGWTRAQPGVVKLVRGSESLEVRVLDKKQRLVPATLPQFARFLRSKSGADHPIDARLVTLVATVSDHFGGREVNVVSGFRPYSPSQYSRHSNHNEGRAIDFSIKGIANETVRDYCRTLHNVGVGYYPNSLFVHLDVRESNAYWVDYAAPGQAPRYRAPDGTMDDGDEAAIASVDRGPQPAESPSTTLRDDITRGGARHAPVVAK